MNSRFTGFILCALFCQTLFSQAPVALDIFSARNHHTPIHIDISSTDLLDIAQFDDSGLEAYSTFQINKEALNLIQMSEQPLISFDLTLKNRDYELELIEVDFLHPEFKVVDAEGQRMDVPTGKFYRGIVNGHPESYAAVSIFKDEVVGVFSTPSEGNFVIGKLDNAQGAHVFYNEGDLSIKNEFECGTLEDMHRAHTSESAPARIAAAECKKVNIYIEVDNIMYNDFNRNQTSITNYVTGLFNVSGVLYENEDVLIGIKTIKIWTTQDGYRKNNSRALLDDFSDAIKNDIDGDIGHCLTTTPGSLGGIAWVDVLCSSYNPNQHYNRTAISDIGTSYRQYPQYSWSAMVITHEMGHNLGSPHTHSCSWGPQGNQTLDNCASPQGGCAPGPTPTGGGTIMSYCHLTSYGINFTKGFGQEPGDLIRSRIQNAGCLGNAFEATAEVEGASEFYEGDSTMLKAKPFGVQYSYQWFRNGGAISGAVNPTLTVKQSGNYYCEVSTICYETTNTVDVTVNKFYVSLHCPIQDAEAGSAILKLDTFYVDVTETEYFYDVPQSLRDQVPTSDVAETSIEMEVCMGNYFPSRLADLNLSVSGPPMSNLNDREIRNHKTVVFGDRCYVISLGDFDPTGEWIFLASDNNNNIPTGPESYVSVEMRQQWLLDPRPSDCDLYICSGDTSILDAGIPGLNYKWSTGDTTQQITITQAGTYSVTVSNGPIERSDEINVFILTSNYQLDTTICEGDVFVLGDQDITEAGMYIDTLVSSKGCDSILSVNVMTNEVPRLEEDLLVCFGDTYNDIVMTKDTVIETRFNLMAGCDSFYILNITVNPELQMELEAKPGCEDVGATVKVMVSGGTKAYEYIWDNGAADPEITGVASGPLTCLVTDASNCTSTDLITIENFDSVAASGVTMMVACYGDSTGSVDVTVLEGTSPFDFTWTNGQVTEDLMSLPVGQYELVIADSNKCQETMTFDIAQNAEIEAKPKVTGPNKGQNNGMIELFPFGGSGSFTYKWEDGSTESERTGLSLGVYSVTVMDSLGCSREFDIEVTVNTSLHEIIGLVDFQMYPNPVHDQLILQLELLDPEEIEMELIDVYGKSVSKWRVNSSLKIDSTIDVSDFNNGIYFLKLTVGQQSGVVQVIKQ